MSEIEIMMLILSLQGLLIIALGYAMRGISRNRVVGIRTNATLSDERVWRETHERYGPRFAVAGAAILVGGVALVVAPGSDGARLALFVALAVGSLGWFTVSSLRYANARLRHWREVDAAAHNASAE